MIPGEPKYLLGGGCVLMAIGWILPMLMVMQMLESTFFLNFFAYAASTVGLFLGIIGVATYARRRKK